MRARVARLRNYVSSNGLGPYMVRATAGSSAVHLAGMLFTFLVGVQLARGLGVEGYGHYGIAMAVIAIASVPGEYGIPKLVVREVAAASAHDDRARIFGVLRWADKASWTIGAVTLAASIGLAVFLSKQAASPAVSVILWGLAAVPLVAFARSRGAALQGLHYVVLGQVPFNLLRPLVMSLLLVALFGWWPDAGAHEAMALNVVTAAAALLLGELWLRSRLPGRPASIERADRRWLASSVPMALADGIRIAHLQIAVLVLGILATSEEVGLFRIAASIVVMVQVPVALMNRVTSPVLAKLHAEEDRQRLQKVCTHTAQVMAAAVIGLSLPFLVWGETLISFIFGQEFAPAYPAVVILCAGQIGSASFGPNATLLTMTGHERRVTRAMFIALPVNLAIAALLAPFLGSEGVALAVIGSLLTWNVLMWLDAKRLLGVQTSLVPARWGARGAPPNQAG